MNHKLIIACQRCFYAGIIGALSFQSAMAEENHGELAKKLANPIANFISVPLQLNYDENIGADDEGSKYLFNIRLTAPETKNPDETQLRNQECKNEKN